MILTRDFVFLHVPRTGGNFVRRVLVDHAPASWRVEIRGVHGTRAELGAPHHQLPIIAFVRNPFAWYVSWFHFQQRVRDPFFLEVSAGGTLDFRGTMHRALGPSGRFHRTAGPFTQTLIEILGVEMSDVHFGMVESLRDDLVRLLGSATTVPPAMAAAIRSLPPQNTAPHQHFSHYYDAELRAMVRAKDALVFDHFGYDWEEPAC